MRNAQCAIYYSQIVIAFRPLSSCARAAQTLYSLCFVFLMLFFPVRRHICHLTCPSVLIQYQLIAFLCSAGLRVLSTRHSLSDTKISLRRAYNLQAMWNFLIFKYSAPFNSTIICWYAGWMRSALVSGNWMSSQECFVFVLVLLFICIEIAISITAQPFDS